MNKEIKIKCLLCDSLDIYNYYICLYDSNNCLIESAETIQGCASFCVSDFGLYKVVITPKCFLIPNRITSSIYINNDTNNFLFTFNKFIYKRHSIIINLMDKNYKNLSIGKGEIHLWEKKL